MSPETSTGTVRAFHPAALDVSSTKGVDSRARAAGYAAGWTAGARAAAEAGAEQQRFLAEQSARAQAERDAALIDALAVLEAAVAAASARSAPAVAQARRAVHEGALELAAAVLQRELVPGPASARSLLERALALPVEVGVHTVRLNPRDLAQVTTLLTAGSVTLPAGVELVADPRLSPGDAISEHSAGYLDGQIGSALARARAALLEDQVEDIA
ncbi:FliH/SctL family protein [Cellulomonas sp. KRMCY2]|uniref:FliH/SctL family protein n=1 Tax=Cellulomonas sp. KRMCY2 TaxID=1304865 RepID=UPI00045E97D9|nr:FliH/SctL family protein [Cellulomonas sp. KRMCY2]